MSKRKASEVYVAYQDAAGALVHATRTPSVRTAKAWVTHEGVVGREYVLYREEQTVMKEETVRTRLVNVDTPKEPA